MFKWSRFESWLAVVLSVLLVTGALGHWWLDRRSGRALGPQILEPVAAAAAPSPAPESDPPVPRGVQAGSADTADAPTLATCPEPVSPAADSTESSGASHGATDTRIDINRAQASELERLPGVGPALARRIVEYREAWGLFTAVEDILEVPGIGPAKFNAIKDLIKVE
ncbi:MAG TPA: ComEA family DNA-binding protein [Limnochordales bacterium]